MYCIFPRCRRGSLDFMPTSAPSPLRPSRFLVQDSQGCARRPGFTGCVGLMKICQRCQVRKYEENMKYLKISFHAKENV